MKTSTKIKLAKYGLKTTISFIGLITFFIGIGITDSSLAVGFFTILVGALIIWISDVDYQAHMDEALTRVFNIKCHGR